MRQVVDIAWVAGFLEGEGSFSTWGLSSLHKGKKYTYGYPKIQAATTDRDIAVRAAGILGCRFHGPYMAKKSTKPFWVLSLINKKAAEWMMTIYPFLGIRRRAKVYDVLARWRTHAK